MKQFVKQALYLLKFRKGVHYKIAGQMTKINAFTLKAIKHLKRIIRPHLKNRTSKYIFTGHSLGGALASVLALEMTQEFNVSK